MKVGVNNETVYFNQPGSQNTTAVLEIVEKQAKQRGIDTLVIASTSGATALKAQEKLGNQLNIIAVGTYENKTDPEKIEKFKKQGGQYILAFEDVSYDYPEDLQTELRQDIGQGGKVALEVVIAAVLADLVKKGEKVIGVGGAYPGADTAFIVEATDQFNRNKIIQILCHPKN